jgi:hypothetical protein
VAAEIMGRSCSGSTRRQFALAAGIPDRSHSCGTERSLWIGRGSGGTNGPSGRSCPVESCVTDFKNPTVLDRAKKGALFQSVHSLIPDRSLRAGVPSTEPESVCIPMLWTRSQGNLVDLLDAGTLPETTSYSRRSLRLHWLTRPAAPHHAATLNSPSGT